MILWAESAFLLSYNFRECGTQTLSEVLLLQENQNKLSANKSGFGNIIYSKAFCFLAPFAALLIYFLYLLIGDKFEWMSGYYTLSYLYTYDHGFLSRGFVGEVISWFVDIVTPTVIKTVIVSGAALLLVAASLCFGAVLNKTRDNPELHKTAMIIIAFLIAAPFTFRTYLGDMKLDKFFWALALFSVLLCEKKLGIWFVPVLCFVSVLINPVFLFGAMFLVAIILLQKCYESGFAVKNIIICAVSYIGMIALGAYALNSELKHGFADAHEMASFYFKRYSEPVIPTVMQDTEELLFEYFEKKDSAFFKKLFNMYFLDWGSGRELIFNTVFFVVPVYSFLISFWVKSIRAEKEKFQKFIFFLCAATTVIVFVATPIAWATTRLFAYMIDVQLGMLLYYLAHKKESVASVTGKVWNFVEEKPVISAFFVAYIAMFFYNTF